MQRYLFIALGGALGSIARYQVGALAAERFGMRFPVGTLVINISACLLIGFSVEFLNRHSNINAAWRYLVPVGFIGAYSTFSTFEVGDMDGLHFRGVLERLALYGGEPCGRALGGRGWVCHGAVSGIDVNRVSLV